VKPTHVLVAASVGAVIGVVASGLWWTVRDRSYVCEGGCSPLDKNLPPGDLTLMAGALGGVLVAVVLPLLSRLLWQRMHR
jgi:hypothetical protein